MFSKEIIKSFNDLDMKIYEYVLANRLKIPYMSIRDISKDISISPASIVRFCKKLGFSGFNEFKYTFKESMKEDISHHKYDMREVVDCLNKFQLESYQEKFNEATILLSKADTVLFFGVGDSGIIAQYGARRFSSAGKFALSINDPYYRINFLEGNYVAIALSISGETREVIREIDECKSQGCKVIAITTSVKSTIARMSDITIPYYINRVKHHHQELTSQAPALTIIENLAKMSLQDY